MFAPNKKSYLYILNTFLSQSINAVRSGLELNNYWMNAQNTWLCEVLRRSQFIWDEPEFTKGGEWREKKLDWANSHLKPWAKIVFVAIDLTGFEDCPTYKNCIVRILDGFPYWYNVSFWSDLNLILRSQITLIFQLPVFTLTTAVEIINWAIVIRVDSQRLRALWLLTIRLETLLRKIDSFDSSHFASYLYLILLEFNLFLYFTIINFFWFFWFCIWPISKSLKNHLVRLILIHLILYSTNMRIFENSSSFVFYHNLFSYAISSTLNIGQSVTG